MYIDFKRFVFMFSSSNIMW